MVRNLAMLCFLLIPTITHAQLESAFTFSGQNAEILKSEKTVSISSQVTSEVPSMCARSVPNGQERVCHNVTRYREECQTMPSSQSCSNVAERVCRPVTRYRQECSRGPSRRECTSVPTREVCTERPTREVCTTRPDGKPHCTTVGGGRSCTTVGGGESCRQVEGSQTCRQVSYSDDECTYVPRSVCTTKPSYQSCSNVPYSEQECGMQTRYRTETYACTETRTNTVVTKKIVKAETDVQIITNGLVEEFPVKVLIQEADQDMKAFTMGVSLAKEPKIFVVLKKKEVEVVSESKTEINLRGSLVLEVLSKEMLPLNFPQSIKLAKIDKASEKLVVQFEGPISAVGSVDLIITHKAFLSKTKTIAEFKGEYPGNKVSLGIGETNPALSIDLKGSLKNELQSKNMSLKFKLISTLNFQGELLNATKPVNEKLYEGSFVRLE
jgi:hypothetical protein